MRRLILTLAAALTALPVLTAGPKTTAALRAEMDACPGKYGGVYFVDDFAERDLTPAPKGYKPFYISTYARHGARYILYEKQYDRIWKAFSSAREKGNLTPEGEVFCARFEAVYPQLKGHGGELSAIGKAQHKSMGARMIANYPEVFKGDARVEAFSTEVPRTIQSMTCFLEGLREANTRLRMHSDASRADKPFLNPLSSDSPKVDRWFWDHVRAADAPWRQDYARWFDSKVDTDAILGRLFRNPAKATGDAQTLVADLFALASDMQCVPVDASFWDLFTDDERFALWELDNYIFYAEKGPDPCNFDHGYGVAGYMLDDILARADRNIASGAVQADLRFGHDGCLIGLLTLMDIGSWHEVVPRDSVKNVWQVQDIPMAANLQLIFYRNKAGDVLVKPLLNEKNLALPIPAVTGPYYRWSDVRDHYRPIADAAIRLVETDDPATLTGRVFADGKPLAGVQVSDGVQIVRTDAEGRYRMFSDKRQGSVFVITPSGYVATSADGIRPDFYAPLTKDRYTAEEHDFQLRSEDQSRCGVILVADMHLTGDKKLDDQRRFREQCMPLIRRTAEKLAADGPVYSFNLGDLSFDKYWVRDKYTLEDAYATLQQEGWPVPLYSVPGNHDNDGRISTDSNDFDAGWLYRKVLGPEHYSLDIGGDHWIVMDDIIYDNHPGKPAKRAEGMAGIRDFRKGFTETEMTFLRNDLAAQPDGKRIFLCTHCPLLTGLADGDARFDDSAQMRELDSLFARFGQVRVFAGHTHQTEWKESEAYPHISDLNVGGLSGNAWCTGPSIYGKFGCSAGVVLARFAPGEERYSFDSVEGEDDCFRVYDLNEAAAYYAASPVVREFVAEVPLTVDFAKGDFRNMLYINDWFLRPGETLEVLEVRGGRPVALPVTRVEERDPYFDIGFFCRDGEFRSKYKEARAEGVCPHLFSVRTRSPRSEVILRVRDASGETVREARVRRPVPFRP